MSRSRTLPNLLAAATLAALPMASAWAQQQPSPPANGQGGDNRAPERRGMSDSVRRAERDARGQVLSAERVQYDGRDMHRVKVVDGQGRVRVYMQDPAQRDTGQPRGVDSRRPSPPARDNDD
ncbi:MAG: hypothetical protein QM612_11270 [Thermomonas sp.]|uniref:PepSY domain-containing protein n=1 Tax=Thermomonas sp. TaxID=1971895 RepID=UPI0039E72853